jgi:hypothetical protein
MGNITGKRKREEVPEDTEVLSQVLSKVPVEGPEKELEGPEKELEAENPPEEAEEAQVDPPEEAEEAQVEAEEVLRASGLMEYLESFQGGMSRDSIKTLLSRLVDAVEFSYEQVVYLITSIFQSLISLVAI